MLSTVFFDGGKVNFRQMYARGCVVENNKIRVLVSEDVDTNIPVFYLYQIRATKYTVRR